jgi:ABC-type proline/glycine betaine transport system permease subunit
MNTFPDYFKFNPGIYVEALVDWLIINFQGFFDALTVAIKWIVFNIQDLLSFIPWFLFILLVFLLGWKLQSFKSGLGYAIMITTIGLIGLWDEMIFTLSIVITSVILA